MGRTNLTPDFIFRHGDLRGFAVGKTDIYGVGGIILCPLRFLGNGALESGVAVLDVFSLNAAEVSFPPDMIS